MFISLHIRLCYTNAYHRTKCYQLQLRSHHIDTTSCWCRLLNAEFGYIKCMITHQHKSNINGMIVKHTEQNQHLRTLNILSSSLKIFKETCIDINCSLHCTINNECASFNTKVSDCIWYRCSKTKLSTLAEQNYNQCETCSVAYARSAAYT